MSTPTRPAAAPSRLPRPAPVAGQRIRDLLRGSGCALALLGAVAGVPAALVLLVGSPLPTTPPSRQWLSAELDTGAVVRVLATLLWLAWSHFLVCVVAEVRAWRHGGPARAAWGGAPQVAAQRLVAGVLLLSSTAVLVPGSAAGAVSAAGAPAAVVTAPAPQEPDPQVRAGADPDAAATPSATAGGAAPKWYEVRPPDGRRLDCLWDIAERTLGDPLRYREIHELNRDRLQPDGLRLGDVDLIRPGWVLLLPPDATGAGVVDQVTAAVTPVLATGEQETGPGWPEQGAGPGWPEQGAGPGWPEQGAGPGWPEQGTAPGWPDTVQETPGGGAVRAQGAGPVATTAADEDPFARAGLLATGLLLALLRRPGGSAAPGAVQRGLAAAADPARARFLDAALRGLASACAADGRPLPQVVAVRLDDEELLLHHRGERSGPPPAPWREHGRGSGDRRTWSVRRTDLPVTGPAAGAAGRPAPYPALVEVAALPSRSRLPASVLVDLQAASGVLALGGDPGRARQVAVSMALSLATSAWSDGVRVALVGFADDLAAVGEVAPGRLETAASLAEVLRRAERPAGGEPPHVVILSGPPTAEEQDRLRQVPAEGRGVRAAVCVGDLPTARWRFVVDADGRIDLGFLGLTGQARLLDAAATAELAAAFTGAAGSRHGKL